MTTTIVLGDGDNMGVSLPAIADYNISIGTGANDFVVAFGKGPPTSMSGNTITFGDGANNFVSVPDAQNF